MYLLSCYPFNRYKQVQRCTAHNHKHGRIFHLPIQYETYYWLNHCNWIKFIIKQNPMYQSPISERPLDSEQIPRLNRCLWDSKPTSRDCPAHRRCVGTSTVDLNGNVWRDPHDSRIFSGAQCVQTFGLFWWRGLGRLPNHSILKRKNFIGLSISLRKPSTSTRRLQTPEVKTLEFLLMEEIQLTSWCW